MILNLNVGFCKFFTPFAPYSRGCKAGILARIGTAQGVLESDWLQAGSRMERQAEPWKAGFSESQGANAGAFFCRKLCSKGMSPLNCNFILLVIKSTYAAEY